MRQIRFRGKDIQSGEWLHGDLIQVNGQTFIHRQTDCDVDNHFYATEVDPTTVGQLINRENTTLLPIYENDIVQVRIGDDWRSLEVVSVPYIYQLMNDRRPVGNVFDNPELAARAEVEE